MATRLVKEIKKGNLLDEVVTEAEIYACGCKHYFGQKQVWDINHNFPFFVKFDEKWGIIVYYMVDGDCDNCAEIAQLKEEKHPDSSIQSMTFSHGLATGFCGTKSAADVKQAFCEIAANVCSQENTWEICCSLEEQRIGGMGIAVKGEVTVASNRDLWSTVNGRGERVFEVEAKRRFLITSASEIDTSVWDHTEFFVRAKGVEYVWVKDWFLATPGIRELCKELETVLGVEVRVVSRRH